MTAIVPTTTPMPMPAFTPLLRPEEDEDEGLTEEEAEEGFVLETDVAMVVVVMMDRLAELVLLEDGAAEADMDKEELATFSNACGAGASNFSPVVMLQLMPPSYV
jgi:hypothetical protein